MEETIITTQVGSQKIITLIWAVLFKYKSLIPIF